MYAKWAVMAYEIRGAHANTKADGNYPDMVIANVSATMQVTSVASPTAPLSATLPSQVPLPPPQAWCPSKIFCPGAVRHHDSDMFSTRFRF